MAAAKLELDIEIRNKLRDTFKLTKEDIDTMLCFIRDKLKPDIKYRYLSHLVSTLEDMINNQEKQHILEEVVKVKELEKTKETQSALQSLEQVINSKHYRLFVIMLVPITKSRKNATTRIIENNAVIYYNSNLDEKDKRLLIAHELGHIVEHFIFKKDGSEGIASLFAYIAMLYKNNFYKDECSNYIYKSDVTIFNELKKVLNYN